MCICYDDVININKNKINQYVLTAKGLTIKMHTSSISVASILITTNVILNRW